MSALWMSTLTEAAVRTTALLGVAAIIALLLRQRAAAVRHLVWALALGGALVLPLVGAALPRVAVPVPRAIADALPARAAEESTALAAHDTRFAAALTTVPRVGSESPAAPAIGNGRGEVPGTRVLAAGGALADGERPAAVPPEPAGTTARAAGDWNPTFLGLWGLAAGVLGAWALAGVWSTRRLAREAAPVTSREWLETLRDALESLSIRRPVRLLQSDRAVMPMTWGWRRPVILIPAAASSWSSERRAVVLRHELAHVKRADVLTQLLARLACAVYWFNPLVWFAAYRLRVERERACDDEVLQLGTRASDYANHLLDIAREYQAPGLRASAAVAMARRSQLEGRMLAILAPGVRRVASRSTAILAAAVLTGAALAVSALTPAAQPRGTAPETQFQASPPPAPAETQERAEETGERPEAQAETRERAERTLERGQERAAEMRERAEERREQAEARTEAMRERAHEMRERLAQGTQLRDLAEEMRERFAQGTELRDLAEEMRERFAQGGFTLSGDRIDGDALRRMIEAAGGVEIQIGETLRALRQEERPLDPRLVQTFIGALSDTDAEVRERAARTLGRSRVSEAVPALRMALGDENADVRERAAWALGRIRDEAAVDSLVELLDDPEPDVRERAAWALGMLRSPAAVDGLVAALDDVDEDVQERIAWALGRIGDERATDGLITALDLVAGDALEEAIEALGRVGGDRAMNALIGLMDTPDPEVRRDAIEALSGWSSPGGRPEMPPPPPPPPPPPAAAPAPGPDPAPDAPDAQ